MKSTIKISKDLEQKLVKYYLAPHTLQETAWVILGQKCTKLATAILTKYNIKKHNQAILIDLSKQTCLAKYGVTNPSLSQEVRKKVKETVNKKYGVDNVFQAENIKNKIKDTCLKKYGESHYNKTIESKQRHRKTCFEHYGVEIPLQCEQLKEKSKTTCLKKYGVDNYTKTEQYKLTCALKQAQTIKKQKETKQKNNTFNISRIEKLYQGYLESKYGKNNVVSQYTDSRYPFSCDFYIKSFDLFIELNLTWTHGGKLFEGTDSDLKKLKLWKEKAKTSKYYQNAIYTWTDLDIRKHNTAKENNLNYIVYYSKTELLKGEKLWLKIKRL